jgi:hypothetical protein
MKYKRLYIIGNGFDLHHGIKSGYSEFRDFLIGNKEKSVALDILTSYYNANDDEFWNSFENNLSKFDVKRYTSEKTYQYYPDFSKDDNIHKQVENASFNAEIDFEILSDEIKNAFHDWICTLNRPDPNKKIDINKKDGFFINFNYTKTLEDLYNIPSNIISHIHGCVDIDENFIIGHGDKISENDITDNITDDLPDDYVTIEDIKQYYENQYDPIEDNIKNVTIDCVNTFLKKDVIGIIRRNYHIFEHIDEIEEIYIYGWSFSNVDLLYLRTIMAINKNLSNIKWAISFFREGDKETVMKFLNKHNVLRSQVSFVRLYDLMYYGQPTLF